MDFDVKNTIVRELFELFCPHYCLVCGKIGKILCNGCKKYNIEGYENKCLKCGVVIKSKCEMCRLPYEGSWMVGMRDDGLGQLISKYKYGPVRALAWPLAEILDAVIPCLGQNTVVVPVPTIDRHIRTRGMGHTELLARKLARSRGWAYKKVVSRVNNTVQVGASVGRRKKQASDAYRLNLKIDPGLNYLVIDDVYTTGASIEAVCELLRAGGARKVMVAVLARAGKF